MIEFFMKSRKYSQSRLLFSVLLLGLAACDSSSPTGPDPKAVNNFADLEVGQEWRYAKWEKRHAGERVFTGDTVSVSVTSVEAGLATFFERTLNVESPTSSDSSIFQFEVSDSLFRQVGSNRSRLFGFVSQHDGRLFLSGIDSNPVMIDLETSLFLLREQIGQSKFIGRSNRVQLLFNSYEDVIVYFDETSTYVDGFGHVAIVSQECGIASTIFFGGGRGPIEAFGYELVR